MKDILDSPMGGKGGQTILDHPPSLFVLFFTEMWERFSYYGMRALLVLFLTASIMDDGTGGYGWERKNALELYALYTGLVYLTPLFGGMIADKITGYRKAVVLGALIMAIGHGCMAIEAIPAFFYAGLTCLIVGNGLFKPNISSMVGQLYEGNESKKDSAYTIFYMGINAGAFLGILLCGYIGEKIGWSYGFGLAGVFMLLGMLQFWFAQDIFGKIGLAPKAPDKNEIAKNADTSGGSRLSTWAGIGIVIALVVYFLLPKEAGASVLNAINKNFIPPILFGGVTAIVGFIITDPSLTKIEKDRVWVIIILTFFTIFFWWAFEQAGGSMTVFASDYTDRTLEGSGAMIFKIANSALTLGSLSVITWVLFKLFKVTFDSIKLSNIILGTSFLIIWGIVIWMLNREFQADETDVPASWFSILNSFFIITMAPAISKFWEKGIIKSGPIKFALGLIILGLGFGLLAWGSAGIPQGAKTASVSMVWLILAYFFHTTGELCVSPVGLSYVSKLAPVRLIGLMFGVWFIANFVANWAGGMTGSYIDQIVESTSMSTFFLIFTLIPIGAGIVLVLISKFMKKMMHGID